MTFEPPRSNPARRSILKSPTFQFTISIQPPTRIVPLSTSLTDQLSMELVEYCIDFLHNDKETLRNCGLVCKAWLVCARFHLFRKNFTVYIQNHTGDEVFTILTTPGSTLAGFVHQLCIQTTATFTIRKQRLTNGCTDLHQPGISFNEYLLPFVGASDSLKTLTFHGVKIRPRASSRFSAIAPQIKALSRLTRLELTRCAFSTFEEFLLVICSGASLLELLLTDITVLHWSDQTPPDSWHLPRRLQHLSLNTPGQSLILKWILSHPRIPVLKAVCLGVFQDADDQQTIGRFLRALGPHLKHLKLNLVRWTHEINLSHNTTLQSLSISHYLIGEFASENISPSGGLVKILGQISSLQVAKIDLHFVNAPRDLLLMPWSAVARELDSPKFSRLRLVRIRSTGKKEKWEDVLREGFPRLSACGILQILWDSSAFHDSD
ncbi:hypothetical protein BDZ97DRAFT_1118955 [Flammula alnicola]|nr:hypothetical protein BDZ97DRAFT_1675610 [Flammula alnicola]KAF8962268.1 hypothetical protein BDZ97DRAFT_1118955 [Flammula alnicola]